MGCSLGSPPLCVLGAVSRRVPWNADGKPLDKINSRGAPSSLVSKDKETRCGVSLGGVGGGGWTPTQHVTRGSPCTWQGSSRHRPHFPDQEPMKNSVPTCWRESRGPGPHLPALSPLPRPTPEGQCSGSRGCGQPEQSSWHHTVERCWQRLRERRRGTRSACLLDAPLLPDLAGGRASRLLTAAPTTGQRCPPQPRTQERDQPPRATSGPTPVTDSCIDPLGRWTPAPPQSSDCGDVFASLSHFHGGTQELPASPSPSQAGTESADPLGSGRAGHTSLLLPEPAVPSATAGATPSLQDSSEEKRGDRASSRTQATHSTNDPTTLQPPTASARPQGPQASCPPRWAARGHRPEDTSTAPDQRLGPTPPTCLVLSQTANGSREQSTLQTTGCVGFLLSL